MKHIENLLELIKKGEVTLAPGFMRDKDGSLRLIEMSLVAAPKSNNTIKLP